MKITEINSNKLDVDNEIGTGPNYLERSSKFKGVTIDKIPTSYLLWYISTIDDIDKETIIAVEEEIEKRKAKMDCYGDFMGDRRHLCLTCDLKLLCDDETDDDLTFKGY